MKKSGKWQWDGEMKRRVLMTVAGVTLSGISVGMFNTSAFGMDPFQVLAHGIWGLTNITFGTFYMIMNLIMLIGVFLVDRTKIGLGTFVNIFLLGYAVELSSWFFSTYLPHDTYLSRGILLMAGLVILSFGSSLYFVSNMGVSTYDAVALILSERTKGPFALIRIGCDLFCSITGWLLGAVLGIGTVMSAFCMGPLISFFNRTISEPLRYGKRMADNGKGEGK